MAASVSVTAGHHSHLCCPVLCPTTLPLSCSTSRAPLTVSCHASEHSSAENIPTKKKEQVVFFHIDTSKWLCEGAEDIRVRAGDGVGLWDRVAPHHSSSCYISLGCRGAAAVYMLIREESVEAHSLRKEAANEHLSIFPFSHAKGQFF